MLKFAKDLEVSGRILAIISETKFTRKFGKIEREEMKVKVICGSNNKESTRYFIIRDNKYTNKLFKDISNEELIRNYPKQCEKFKRRFKTEYENLLETKK